jgi:hypothetical protein
LLSLHRRGGRRGQSSSHCHVSQVIIGDQPQAVVCQMDADALAREPGSSLVRNDVPHTGRLRAAGQSGPVHPQWGFTPRPPQFGRRQGKKPHRFPDMVVLPVAPNRHQAGSSLRVRDYAGAARLEPYLLATGLQVEGECRLDPCGSAESRAAFG